MIIFLNFDILYTLSGECAISNVGREFVLLMMENVPGEPELEIIAAAQGERVYVDISAPLALDLLDATFGIDPNGIQTVSIPSELVMRGTELAAKGIYIKADVDIVVYALNKATSSCAATLLFPLHSLGFEYFAVAWNPPSEHTQLGVVATKADTTVQITFHPQRMTRVEYAGSTYLQGSTLQVTMDAHQAIQLQDLNKNDLSGTKITSDHPVAVFSGNNFTSIPREAEVMRDAVMEQMPPVYTWGTEYVLVSTPGKLSMDFFKVIAQKPDTTVTLSSGQVFFLSNSGDPRTFFLTDMKVLTSDKPVMVAKFIASSDEATVDSLGDPSMTILTPTEQFLDSYSFYVPESAPSNFLVITVDRRERNGLLLSGVSLSDKVWEDVQGTTMTVTSFTITPGIHTLTHTGGTGFASYVLGAIDEPECVFSYSAGICLDDITPVSETCM